MRSKPLFQFPGQGSQAVGMGASLATSFPEARAVFDEVNDALGEDLFALMKEGPEDDLWLTRNAQPALFASSMAALAVLQTATGKAVADLAGCVAGHSLGEYSALAAAGTLSITDAARLLRRRGDSMQGAVPPGDGAMAAPMPPLAPVINAVFPVRSNIHLPLFQFRSLRTAKTDFDHCRFLLSKRAQHRIKVIGCFQIHNCDIIQRALDESGQHFAGANLDKTGHAGSMDSAQRFAPAHTASDLRYQIFAQPVRCLLRSGGNIAINRHRRI